jgi:spore germination cell wall hydrolase CwlJ-like protein
MEFLKKSAIVGVRLLVGVFILVLGIKLTMISIPTEEEEAPKEVAAAIDPKQLLCLTKNIYYEAGSESIEGKAAVARVVMNRVAHGFARTPCNVIYQTTLVEDNKVCQFSWVCEGKGEPNKNSLKYKESEEVAYQVLAYDRYKEVVPASTLFFHNIHVDPSWPYRQVAKIGNHIFYSKAKKIKKTKTHQQDV